MFPRCTDTESGKLDNVSRAMQQAFEFEPTSTGLQYTYCWSVSNVFMVQMITFWGLDVNKLKNTEQ